MKAKNVLVDFSNYDSMNGFGEIARNYSARLAKQRLENIHFVFIVPEHVKGLFGNHIDYISKEHLRRELRCLSYNIDLWHATDQLFRYRHLSRNTLQLLTIHDLNFIIEKKGLHKLRYEIMMRHRIKHTDKIVTISNYVQNDVTGFSGLPKDKISVIYNGIPEIEKRSPQRPQFINNEREIFFFTVGTVRKKKNFKVLVPMMKFFPEVKLYICGVNRWEYGKEITSCIPPEDKERIILTGEITDEEKFWMYANCKAFLFPSLIEGFGLPVLEAMRFGCKVFSSGFTSLPEICGEHVSYWDDFSPESMANVVKEGLNQWTPQKAQKALQHSLTFNYERYVDQYITLYRNILGLI